MNDLVVIYRACGSEVNEEIKPFRPPYFSKFKTFKSAWDAFGNKADFLVMWDGDRNELFDYMQTFPLKTIELNYKNNQKSLAECYQVYKGLPNPYVYFLEDDYYHLPYSYEILMEGLSMFSYVTLMDHPDRYFTDTDITKGQEWILFRQLTHWRSAESTTCTVATNHNIFNDDLSDLLYFCYKGVGAPDDRSFFRHIFTSKNRRLFSPIPGVATHMVQNLLGPVINWQKLDNTLVP